MVGGASLVLMESREVRRAAQLRTYMLKSQNCTLSGRGTAKRQTNEQTTVEVGARAAPGPP